MGGRRSAGGCLADLLPTSSAQRLQATWATRWEVDDFTHLRVTASHEEDADGATIPGSATGSSVNFDASTFNPAAAMGAPLNLTLPEMFLWDPFSAFGAADSSPPGRVPWNAVDPFPKAVNGKDFRRKKQY